MDLSALLSKTKSLLKDEKVLLTILVIFSFIIRLFYLIETNGQTLWWDEAEYMSTAKKWAFGVPYNINEQRPPIFQLLAAGLLKLGFGELLLKLILVVLPSVALVLITYILGKDMFGRKIGFIAAFCTGIVWSILFWSARFQPDFFSIAFQLAAFIFFWRFIRNNHIKYAIYTGLFSAFAFYFKISALLVPLSIAIFLFYCNGWKMILKKNNWIILGAFIVGLLPFMVWQAISFGNPLA